MDSLKLTREALYNLVWARPIQQLAQTFGISDVGLAKICKRMEIPRPSRGYWAKIEARKSPLKPALPQLSREGVDQVEFTPTQRRPRSKPTREIPKVMVTDTLSEPHPLVSRTLTALMHGKPDERGVVVPRKNNVLDIRVHRNTIDRACRILDALIKALGALDYPISIQAGDKTTTSVVVNGETLKISLVEKFARTDHVLTPHEQAHYGQLLVHIPPHYDYHPTGILSFCIEKAVYGSQCRWADTKHHKLEERLGIFIQGLDTAAVRMKEWREEDERRKIEYALKEKRRIEEEKRLHLEQSKADKLNRDVQAWVEAGRIRAYVLELQKVSANVAGIKDWIAWAKSRADAIDPLSCPDTIVFRPNVEMYSFAPLESL